MPVSRYHFVVQEIVPSPESLDNSSKHESNEEETPRTSAKRKQRASGKDKEVPLWGVKRSLPKETLYLGFKPLTSWQRMGSIYLMAKDRQKKKKPRNADHQRSMKDWRLHLKASQKTRQQNLDRNPRMMVSLSTT
uniref:Uncharacterized protein LOC104242278 isoform X2 n=1 Tax=Nicotiana sylvestris TaxID=4096 RepID=A0A1U7Y9U8_NICSY|nr:PREDICTED: uncharacterized protein LOC104242278 isoform X2 [Nicotiana sylvestris]